MIKIIKEIIKKDSSEKFQHRYCRFAIELKFSSDYVSLSSALSALKDEQNKGSELSI